MEYLALIGLQVYFFVMACSYDSGWVVVPCIVGMYLATWRFGRKTGAIRD